MDKELEKLIDYAVVDGYISEKEKEVLLKKAKKQGFDIDELEMILEGKQHEKAVDSTPDVDKCPSCGEVLSGLSKVCPSCDYVIDAKSKKHKETLDISLDKLNERLAKLDAVPEPGAGIIFKTAILTFLTFGLHLLYKKLKYKHVFDVKYDDFAKKRDSISMDILKIRQKYGDDNAISAILNSADARVNGKAAQRNKKTISIGALTFVLIGLIYFGISQIPKSPPKPESAEDKTERLIKNDSISKAKIAVANIEDVSTREYYLEKIMLKEIDSFVKIKDYNSAILLTSKLDEGGYAETRKKKLDSVISLEVRELVDSKQFVKAKERTELSSYNIRSNLEEMIKLSETIENDNKKKHKK